MSRKNFTFTSESVSEGHPDKVCDRISDSVLDAFLAVEPNAKVGCETFATTNRVIIGGEVGLSDQGKLKQYMNEIDGIARDAIKDIGYEQEKFHWKTVEITNLLHEQSAHINQGVTGKNGREKGAGDQGIMFGYAVDETPELMPAPIQYAHAVLKKIADARKNGEFNGDLGPDAKSQLSIRYRDGKPVGVDSLVLSQQHLVTMSPDEMQERLMPYIAEVLPEGWLTKKTKLFFNPTGEFMIGGPDGDAGLTGRKIIVDTYGGACAHGGGAFSGKDPTKVDRSAAYAARYLAKNVVAAGLASKCTMQFSYAIGVARPLSVYVDLHGTEAPGVKAEHVEKAVPKVMDLTPRGIGTHFDFNKPIYASTSAYGHFGRAANPQTGEFSWERTDLVKGLVNAL